MAARRILVVEDDPAIRRGIVDALLFAGYEPVEAGTFVEAARKAHPTVPVIAVTALGSEGDRVDGLAQGADDYVVKPFSLRELLARIEAVIRRSAERPSDVAMLELAGAKIDLERREVRYQAGGRAELSERECELLSYLARNPGRAISREELLKRLWKLDPSSVTTRTIDMTVARLREKLGAGAEGAILTVRGKGYMLALGTTP